MINRHDLGDMPIEPNATMDDVAHALDRFFNGEGKVNIGFILLVYPFDKGSTEQDCSLISNCVDRDGVVAVLHEMIQRFTESEKPDEGQP